MNSTRSAVSWPCSVRNTCWVFSSSVKSPGVVTPSPVRGSASPTWRVSMGTMAFIARYMAVLSSAWPLMISGVRASSIRIESTSSTMAKLSCRCTRSPDS
ncbi:hypothetical protein D3C71_1943270 [compost metagenome]